MPSAYFRYSCLLTHLGRFAEARSLIETVSDRHPTYPMLALQAAKIDYYDHRYAKAAASMSKLLDREPSFPEAHYYLALSLGQLGRTSEALSHLRLSHLPPSVAVTNEAWLRSTGGDSTPAGKLLVSRRRLVLAGCAKAKVLLIPALASGDHDTAIWTLHQMWKTQERELLRMRIDPRFDTLRQDPRFQRLMQQIWLFEERGPIKSRPGVRWNPDYIPASLPVR